MKNSYRQLSMQELAATKGGFGMMLWCIVGLAIPLTLAIMAPTLIRTMSRNRIALML